MSNGSIHETLRSTHSEPADLGVHAGPVIVAAWRDEFGYRRGSPGGIER